MPTPQLLLTCGGGIMILPNMPLVDRADGVRLCINTPREVWEHVELSAIMPTQCGFLVAATGQARLHQLSGGRFSANRYETIQSGVAAYRKISPPQARSVCSLNASRLNRIKHNNE